MKENTWVLASVLRSDGKDPGRTEFEPGERNTKIAKNSLHAVEVRRGKRRIKPMKNNFIFTANAQIRGWLWTWDWAESCTAEAAAASCSSRPGSWTGPGPWAQAIKRWNWASRRHCGENEIAHLGSQGILHCGGGMYSTYKRQPVSSWRGSRAERHEKALGFTNKQRTGLHHRKGDRDKSVRPSRNQTMAFLR